MLPSPTPDYVSKRVAEFDGDLRYNGTEPAVALVFNQWPRNDDYHEVLVKIVVLNRLYSTNIYDPYTVAQRILDLAIDERLRAGDPNLVGDLAKVRFRKRTRVLYSFATKYCSWHEPDRFQIYDGYVDWLLWEYRRRFDFARFKRYELREYPRFVSIIEQLRVRFSLEHFSRKQIDKFLWIEGVQRSSAASSDVDRAE